MRREIACCFVVASLLAVSPAGAQEDLSGPQIHGFVSQGYIKTTRNNYLGETARSQGSLEFTEVGINFTQQLGDNLRVGLQLFAHDLGPLGNYAPKLDWYYLDYRFFDWLGIRAGKTKLPWGLYNEASDVDAARVPVLLPQSLYPVANREFLFAQTGGELYGNVPLGSAGTLEYRAYGGIIFVDPADVSEQLRGFDVPYLVGGRAMWRPPLEGLQLGGSVQALRFDFEFAPTPEQVALYQMAGQLGPEFSGDIWVKIPIKLWVASAEYQWQRLALAAEFGRSYFDYETNLIVPETKIVNQGGYVMASYQVAPWFTPGLYYSALFPDIRSRAGSRSRATYQHDVAATLRYDVTPHWIVKLEGHFMHGTAGLSSALNDNRPLDTLHENWGVFLVKTTGYF